VEDALQTRRYYILAASEDEGEWEGAY